MIKFLILMMFIVSCQETTFLGDEALSNGPSQKNDCSDLTHGQSREITIFINEGESETETCEERKKSLTELCDNGEVIYLDGEEILETVSFERECGDPAKLDCGELKHGESEKREMFQSASVGYGMKCVSETQVRTCDNGSLSEFDGDFSSTKCSVLEPLNCEKVAHGEVDKRLMYKSSVVGFGEKCVNETQYRKCDNGKFSEFSGDYKFSTCVASKPKDCGVLTHGMSQRRTMYKEMVVSPELKCEEEVQYRNCKDGILSEYSGSFEHLSCEVQSYKDCGDVKHGEKSERKMFKESSALECHSEVQTAICKDGQLSDYSGDYQHSKCSIIDREPSSCVEGKVLTVSIDYGNDGVIDTKPSEIIAYTGDLDAKSNYNYYSVSAHPKIGPKPDGHKAIAYFYDGKDGLSLQFVFNNDKIKGQPYNGSPNSIVHWNFYTENNDLLDSVIFSDDGKELKYKETFGQTKKYKGSFHYWNNTDGGVIGPFVTEDFRIKLEPMVENEVKQKKKDRKVISTEILRSAFDDVSFYSLDGSKVPLKYVPGRDAIIIEYKEVRDCNSSPEEIGCSDNSREGFKSLKDFPNIAACAGGFREQGVLPEHRERKCDQAGNDSSNPEGHGCSIQDVCAKGWEALPSLSVLQEYTYGDFCHAMEKDEMTKNVAFVSGITGEGWGRVYNDDEQLYAILNYKDYDSRDYKKHVNDLFYCGGEAIAYSYGNHPYKKYFSSFTNNQCYGSSEFSKCQSKNGHLEALEYKQTLDKASDGSLRGGGVICVKSKAVDELNIDERLRRVVKEEPKQCHNMIKNGSFEEGHNINSKSWNVFKNVGEWMVDTDASHAGIEVQCQGVGGFESSHKSCHVELDAHHGRSGFTESDVAMYQIVELEEKSYVLSFDERSRNGVAHSNMYYVKLENEDGDAQVILKKELEDKNWNKSVFVFKSPFSGKVKLTIGANQDEDTLGANVDNFELYPGDCKVELPIR